MQKGPLLCDHRGREEGVGGGRGGCHDCILATMFGSLAQERLAGYAESSAEVHAQAGF